jgi:hypothetical protein
VRDCTGERPGGSTVQLCVRNGLDDLLQWTLNAAEMGVATTEMLVLAAERGLIKCAAILILAPVPLSTQRCHSPPAGTPPFYGGLYKNTNAR